MSFKGRNIISTKDFSRDELLHILDVTAHFKHSKTGYVGSGVHRSQLLSGKQIAILMFEPSTRTQFSFGSAAISQGASHVYCYEQIGTLDQNIMQFHAMGNDAIVLRHRDNFSAQRAVDTVASLVDLVNAPHIPILNAGDSTNEHPTQSLLDLYTIREEKGTIDGLKIALIGDLKNGRTVHSLAYALAQFNVEVYFVSSQELQMPQDRLTELTAMGLKHHLVPIGELRKIMRRVDVGYVTRIQKERFAEDEYAAVKGSYCIDAKMMRSTKNGFLLLHPGPIVDEISRDVYHDPNDIKVAYWRQIKNGLHVREALFSLVLGALQ